MQASASVTASGDSKAAIGEALKQALSGNRLQSISLHDERGDVLWLDEGALGPDEHNLVVEAAAALSAGTDRTYVFQSIGDGRAAAFLPARSPLNDLLGLAMIIADAKFLDSKGAAKFVTPTTTNLMRRLAFLRKPSAPAAPLTPPPPSAPAANRVVSPQPAKAPVPPPPRPGMQPPPAARPAAPAAARPGTPVQQPAAPQARAPAPPAPRPGVPARPPMAPPKAAQPVAKPAAPAARSAPPAKPASQQRPSGNASSDSIAFEISDIDPKSLLKGAARQAQPEPKRPDLRVVQTDRLPKLELKLEGDPIPELIQDEPPAAEVELAPMYAEPVDGEEETTEVEALEPDADMNVEPEFVDEVPQLEVGAGQFEFYGQIFELHVQQLVKLKGTGGTRRFEVLVRDAHADNEFGVAPDRVMQDVHDPSANSDLDRIVVEQLVIWMSENRGAWETEPSSFSINVGMGTIADPKFASFVATTLKTHKVPPKAIGFEITEKSCVEQVRDVDMFVQSCEKIGCHLVLDDFTLHHNSLRWLGSSALKFLKLEPKLTAVAMKDRVPQALVVAIAQACKVLGLSCVAKRVDTPAVRDWLSAVGLDYAQGFLLDQPRALTKLAAEKTK
ncbi:MAG TPA: EAL domain-containing protein [Steroidobacteraceae bacterium]|jgi:EAL domain-containing protein (putative c-di-GMP-specific phosphodiesterase class I)|nr:EAL domain-containing protein [Steroidobacteraceae bacterium]